MNNANYNLNCPLPNNRYSQIVIAHGGGGKLMNDLIEQCFIKVFDNSLLKQKHDSTVMTLGNMKFAFTTDSFVVSPVFFQGGDIGKLSVYGTVNDLAMSGAKPLYLSLSLILEEGFSIEHLVKISSSIQHACNDVGIYVVTGDTKVVEKGKGDGIFITTSGIGVVEHNYNISPYSIKEDDVIIINGDIGRHGICILSARAGFEFESEIETDSCDLSKVVLDIISHGVYPHCMRDCTRGGLASSLVELSKSSKLCFEINETEIPVREDVQGACEILGFDPIYVANEGRFVIFVNKKDVDKVCEIMNKHKFAPAIIGQVKKSSPAQVVLKSKVGSTRIIEMISGEQLPRIC